MQRRKSARHQIAANARWRAAEARAQAERNTGISDRAPMQDCRTPIALDLRPAGGPCLVLEPRYGYVAWRARDAESGEVKDCAALKELLHRIADKLPRQMGASRRAYGEYR